MGGDAALSPPDILPHPKVSKGEISPGMSRSCAAPAFSPLFPSSGCSGKQWTGTNKMSTWIGKKNKYLGMLQVAWAGCGHVEGLGGPRSPPKDAASPGARMLLLAMCSHSLMLSKELS